MDLDLQAVGTAGGRGERHGLNVAGVAGGVAGVGDDGQVRQVVQHWHGVEVEGVAGAGLEGADAALAQDDVVVALAHDVLGGHEQLIDRAGHAALKQDRSLGLADLFEQREVLGVAGTDLHDVDLLVQEDLHVARVHDLGDDRHVELGRRLAQQVQTGGAHALVGVRGSAGLIGTAAQHRGTGGLHAAGDADEVLALDGARAGDDLELIAADLDAVTAVDDGVLGVELTVGALERLGDALHALDDVHGLEQERVDLGRIAHQADDRLVLAARDISLQTLFLNPADDMADGLVAGALL